MVFFKEVVFPNLMKRRQFILAMLMIADGFMHFYNTNFYVNIMPGYLPYPKLLVLVSGLTAMELGLMMLWKRTRKVAVWGMIAYFVAVFPANVHIALHPEIFPSLSAWSAWGRLPFQGVFVYCAWRCL